MQYLIYIAVVLLFACPLAAADDIVIADFEGADYGGWSVTGDAFGSAPASGRFPMQQPVFGYAGKGFVNTCRGGDVATGTLTSPEFLIERGYINLLIGGGCRPHGACVNLSVGGKVVRTATGWNNEYLRWATWDVSEFVGKVARISIVDSAKGGWGHVNADEITQSDAARSAQTPVYTEKYRPQFHFTARDNWLNDPNGLVFYKGEWHLFFQHNPTGIEWGNMTWGHAVSPDLVHWTEMEDAILPDELGTIFSGSAVVDWHNTAGFAQGEEKALLAFYTAAGGTSDASQDAPFTQCLAYSTDRGRTWTKYSANPIIPHIRGGNRDPKVIWYEPERKWLMILFTEESTHTLFESLDAKHWTKLQDFPFPGAEECPDFFPMQVDGETKWVLCGGTGAYFIGSFDGKTFTQEAGPFTADFGSAYYATQTYSDAPNGRRIQLAWMRGGVYPAMPFNQQMNFPTEMTLRRFPEGLRICRLPVREIETLRTESHRFADITLTPGDNPLAGIRGELLDISLEIEPGAASEIGITTLGESVTYSPKERKLTSLGCTASVEPIEGRIKLRVLVDRTSLEVYANDGKVVLTSTFLPKTEDKSLALYAKDATAKIVSLDVHELRSAWDR